MGMTSMGAEPTTYRPFDVPVTKPGGGEFRTWDPSTQWTRTYYVDGESPAASDQNAGDAEHPFRTINHAAQILEPGQRVIVRPGVYRECVRPVRGGDGPSSMVGYHADASGPVVIRGSDLAPAKWERQADGIWRLDLNLLKLDDADNPFLLENLPDASFDVMPWAQNLRGSSPYTQARGMVFQDGVRLQRMDDLQQVIRLPGSHWTDRAQKLLLVHPADDRDPNTAAMELTTRQAAIRPAERGLGYIEIRGFTVELIGNGFPRPQEGAISVCAGHHWYIEGNTLRDINGVGIDIGNGWYGRPLAPREPGGRGSPAWTIVRANRVERTGVCGITGLPAVNALIERNVLINNTLYPIKTMYESAGIKTHTNTETLIRQNLIIDNPDDGIWMDWDNRDSRCTQNVIVDCYQGIFVEASVHEPFNMVDRNIIFRATDGIIEVDSWKQTFVHNLICDSKIGIRLAGTVTDRTVGRTPVSAGGHVVAGNLVLATTQPVVERAVAGFPPNTIVDNAADGDGGPATGVEALLDPQVPTLTLTGIETLDAFCQQVHITYDLMDRPWPQDHRNPGPLPASGRHDVGPAASAVGP
jgi:hypothetical protein